MRKALLPTVALFALMAMLVSPVAAIDSAATPTPPQSVTTAPLYDFGQSNPPRHGTTTLYRNADGIAVTVDTRHLRGNAAHTFWFAIFNDPASCAGTPCGLDDLGLESASIVFGGAVITTPNGRMRVSSGLDKDVAPAAPLRCCFGPGVTNPLGAEVHIIIQDHLGSVALDKIHEMLQRPGTGPGGAVDVQSSIHLP